MNSFELAVLYELSSMELFHNVEALFSDLTSKLSRIFAGRRIVLEFNDQGDCRQLYHWGFGPRPPVRGLPLPAGLPVYQRRLGQTQELGRLWLERLVPFEPYELRLLDIFSRHVEKALYAIRWNEELASANDRFQRVIENAPMVAIHGFDGQGTILYWNRAAEDLYGFSREEVLGRRMSAPPLAGCFGNPLQQAVAGCQAHTRAPSIREREVSTRGGGRRTVLSCLLSLPKTGATGEYMRMEVDISERKGMEEQLKYFSLHDNLTGLYNRNFFEQELARLDQQAAGAIGIIICDLDGLKVVNDTLGHQSGDAMLMAVAGILKSMVRSQDVVARIGGDEFALLLKGADQALMAAMIGKIRHNIESFNRRQASLPVSLSLGFAVSGEVHSPVFALFKDADHHMYREKLHRSQSNRSAVVQTLMKALEARDYITEGHGVRLQSMVVALAENLGLPNHQIRDLQLLAQFHDIGKVGIKDHILFKPGSLTAEEMASMQQHCDIGYRIALASPDLVPIADWILKHHEWWDGSGYPLGLKGEEIPLACRMLGIADAFDAMTSDRPYRRALSVDEALAELIRCAGSQFDPFLVVRFREVLATIEGPGPAVAAGEG